MSRSPLFLFMPAAALLTLLMASSCTVLSGRKAPAAAPQSPAGATAPSMDLAVPEPVATHNAVPALDGEWMITKAATQKIPMAETSQEMPYVVFDAPEGRFYAFDGCNVLNGSLSVDTAASRLTLSHVLSTLKACPDRQWRHYITAALADGATYAYRADRINGSGSPAGGADRTLTLTDVKTGTVALTMLMRNMAWLNGGWTIVRADGHDVDTDQANLYFDIPLDKVHGTTGCNYFNGQLQHDPAVSGSITFQDMGVTRMACRDAATETRILVALEEVATARQGRSASVAELLDSRGRVLIVLHKIE